jgi:hypothetical protein
MLRIVAYRRYMDGVLEGIKDEITPFWNLDCLFECASCRWVMLRMGSSRRLTGGLPLFDHASGSHPASGLMVQLALRLLMAKSGCTTVRSTIGTPC